jgi:hypothetical protein
MYSIGFQVYNNVVDSSKCLGLNEETLPCASAFVTAHIDGHSLLMIGDDDLAQMDVVNFAHRRLIVQSIALLVDLVNYHLQRFLYYYFSATVWIVKIFNRLQ